MMRLGTLIELKFLNSSFSSSIFSIRAFRAQIFQFELFELVLLLQLGKQFSVEQFQATASESIISSLPLTCGGQFSKVQSGEMGPAPGSFEHPKGILK